MEPETLSKRIGKVEVLNLNGPFKGDWVSRCDNQIKKNIERSDKDYSIMFVATDVDELDDTAARVLIESSRFANKCAVITRNPLTADVLLKHDTKHKIFIFEDGEKAVFYLGRELAEEDGEPDDGHRAFPRLKVAIPCRGHFGEDKTAASYSVMIVTNLNLKGMFAQLLDHTSEAQLKKYFDTENSRVLSFDLFLSPERVLKLEGNLAHLDASRNGFGVEFHALAESSRTLLKEFLKQEKRLLDSRID